MHTGCLCIQLGWGLVYEQITAIVRAYDRPWCRIWMMAVIAAMYIHIVEIYYYFYNLYQQKLVGDWLRL